MDNLEVVIYHIKRRINLVHINKNYTQKMHIEKNSVLIISLMDFLPTVMKWNINFKTDQTLDTKFSDKTEF